MNVGERSEFIRHLFMEDCLPVLHAKGMDYSAEGDANSTFREIAERVSAKPEQVWYAFFSKHIAAIERYIRDGKVESEPIRGRIVDAINYLAILWSMICSQDSEQVGYTSEQERDVLSLIRRGVGVTLRDISNGTGIETEIAGRICWSLFQDKKIKQKSNDDGISEWFPILDTEAKCL